MVAPILVVPVSMVAPTLVVPVSMVALRWPWRLRQVTIPKSEIHVTMSNVYVLCDNVTLHAIIDNEAITISITL